MKSYFSDIIKQGVPGVLRCSISGIPRNTKASEGNSLGTPQESSGCSRCSTTGDQTVSRTPGTPLQLAGVLLKTRNRAMAHQVHLGTPVIDNIRYYFNERAAILEYDGNLTKEESELLAFKDGLVQYVSEVYPEIETEYRMIIYPPFKEMDNAARQ